MTANEMRRYGLLLLDGASLDTMGYTDSEWSDFLTQAQYEFIKNKFFGYVNVENVGFENNSRRDTELVMLKAYAEISGTAIAQSQIYPNSYDVTLPAPPQYPEYLYNIQERITLVRYVNNVIVETVEATVKPIDEDCVNENLENPFNRPYKYMAWRVTNAQTVSNTLKRQVIIICPTGYVLSNYKCRYLQKPPSIVVDILGTGQVDCILDSSTHEEIVQIAVKKILAASGNPKYQIADKEEKEDI